MASISDNDNRKDHDQHNKGTEESETEMRWVDASIRWSDYREEESVDDEEEGPPPDPFRQDPSTSFDIPFNHDISIHLEGYKMDSDPIWTSTGLTLWRAAHHLGEYLAQHSETLLAEASPGGDQQLQILELGAGLGLCGILAYRLCHRQQQPAHVYVTDGDTDALAALRHNIDINRPKDDRKDSITSISSHQLLWGRDTTESFQQKHGCMHLLLASDIVYAAGIIQPLWETVDTLLPKDNHQAHFLFAYCSRRQVPVSIEQVLDGADEAGFSHERVQEQDGIILYKFTRKLE